MIRKLLVASAAVALVSVAACSKEESTTVEAPAEAPVVVEAPAAPAADAAVTAPATDAMAPAAPAADAAAAPAAPAAPAQ